MNLPPDPQNRCIECGSHSLRTTAGGYLCEGCCGDIFPDATSMLADHLVRMSGWELADDADAGVTPKVTP